MKRRIIAAVAAVILAGVAAFGLFTYVRGADARAMAGQETVEVLVVTKAVPKGTTAEGLTKSVESKLLPQTAVAPGAVTSLAEIGSNLITTADIQVGEQVLTSNFADPASLVDVNSAPVPKGLQEVSVQLDAQRALGGNVVPGNTVGMFYSIKVEKKVRRRARPPRQPDPPGLPRRAGDQGPGRARADAGGCRQRGQGGGDARGGEPDGDRRGDRCAGREARVRCRVRQHLAVQRDAGR